MHGQRGHPPVLVTGGAGFVGSGLVRALRARAARVRVLDDLSTGAAANVPAGVECVVGDVRRRADVERATEGVSWVFHLAAAVGPGLVAQDPLGTWSRNAEGTEVLMRTCARRGIGVLFTSSSEVYRPRRAGDERPFHEDDRVGAPPGDRRGVYARSKLAGETAVLERAGRRGLPVRVARLFNVVGPRQSPRHGMVLARFAEALHAGRPLPVYGDGRQRRCFLHVDDAARALLALVRCPGAQGRAVNVGSVEEVSVRELARRFVAAAGRDPGIRYVPVERAYGAGFRDPCRRRPDLRRIGRLTGWRPRLGLADAIADVIADIMSRRARPRRRIRTMAR